MTATQTGREARQGSLAARLAAVVGEAAAVLGIRPTAEAVSDEVLELVRDPLACFEGHPVWPSLLTRMGLPVELSLKVGEGPALRCVVDVTDHRGGLEANWRSYLRHAEAVVAPSGASDRDVWELCRAHLSGMPPGFRSRMMHGVGYAAPDWYRGSLYFRTGWLQPEQLAGRFPDVVTLLAELHRAHGFPAAGRVEVLGYDFSAGEAVRPKVYVWPTLDGDATFDDVAGRHPDLVPARDLFDAFRRDLRPRPHVRPLLLQAAVEDGAPSERLFFFASAWGWDTLEGLDRLVGFLDGDLGIDVEPLTPSYEIAASHGVPLRLGLVAVGVGASQPSATFYLWPVPAAGQPRPAARRPALSAGDGTSRAALSRRAKLALERGCAYLDALRSPDGCWRDYDLDAVEPGPSDVFVTAYVASMLLVEPSVPDDLARTAGWLLARYRPGRGWGWNADAEPDAETTALAFATLARAGSRVPPDARDVLVRGRLEDGSSGPPDVTAAVLLALLEVAPREIGAALPALAVLCARQEVDGGWGCFWWSDALQATWRALRALRAYDVCEFAGTALGEPSRLLARRAVERALPMLSGLAVPREPVRLGLWLGSWAEAGGEIEAAGRAVTALEELQQPDGRWLGSPSRRIADELFVDNACLVTTATVVGALRTMLAGGTRGGRQ